METKLWFGKHKGKTLSEVPKPYLMWCLTERAGGGELQSEIAAYLSVPIPQKVVPYANETISSDRLFDIREGPGFHAVNKIVDGIDEMNEQSLFLRSVIANARTGNQDAVRVLRNVCRIAADQAPEKDLINMAQQLYDIHSEALRQQSERN